MRFGNKSEAARVLDRMKKRKTLYGLLARISILFILYALVANFIIDPGAKAFLSHKISLKRELNLPVWINVMHIHIAFSCIAMAAGLLNFSNRNWMIRSYTFCFTNMSIHLITSLFYWGSGLIYDTVIQLAFTALLCSWSSLTS